VAIVLRLFSEALGSFLTSSLSHLPEKPVVSFALPGGVSGRHALSLFLCSLGEDSDLRSHEKQYLRDGLDWVSVPPPLRLKCTYVVSAWPDGDDQGESALVQHGLLSAAFSLLVSVDTLPLACLPASFLEPGVPQPRIVIAEDQFSQSPLFWRSVGCLFRPAFSVAATVSLPSRSESPEYLVESVLTDYKFGS